MTAVRLEHSYTSVCGAADAETTEKTSLKKKNEEKNPKVSLCDNLLTPYSMRIFGKEKQNVISLV